MHYDGIDASRLSYTLGFAGGSFWTHKDTGVMYAYRPDVDSLVPVMSVLAYCNEHKLAM